MRDIIDTCEKVIGFVYDIVEDSKRRISDLAGEDPDVVNEIEDNLALINAICKENCDNVLVCCWCGPMGEWTVDVLTDSNGKRIERSL